MVNKRRADIISEGRSAIEVRRGMAGAWNTGDGRARTLRFHCLGTGLGLSRLLCRPPLGLLGCGLVSLEPRERDRVCSDSVVV